MGVWVIQRFLRDGEGHSSEVERLSIGMFTKSAARTFITITIMNWCKGTPYEDFNGKKDLLEISDLAMQKGSVGFEFDEFLCGEYLLIDKLDAADVLCKKSRTLVNHETFQVAEFVKERRSRRKERYTELEKQMYEEESQEAQLQLVEKMVRLKSGRDEDDDDPD